MQIIKKKKKRKSLSPDKPELRCPLSPTNSYNCRGLCEPDKDGLGRCGRPVALVQKEKKL